MLNLVAGFFLIVSTGLLLSPGLVINGDNVNDFWSRMLGPFTGWMPQMGLQAIMTLCLFQLLMQRNLSKRTWKGLLAVAIAGLVVPYILLIIFSGAEGSDPSMTVAFTLAQLQVTFIALGVMAIISLARIPAK